MAKEVLTGGDHWVMFGDGNMARIIASRPYINKEKGTKYHRFMLVPSELIKKMYDTKEDEDPNTGLVIKDYHHTDVVWLEQGTQRSRCWVFVDYEGRDTPASRHYADLKEENKDNEKLLRSAVAAKNRMFSELRQERENQYEAIQQKVRIMREVARARGRVDSDDEDDDS